MVGRTSIGRLPLLIIGGKPSSGGLTCDLRFSLRIQSSANSPSGFTDWQSRQLWGVALVKLIGHFLFIYNRVWIMVGKLCYLCFCGLWSSDSLVDSLPKPAWVILLFKNRAIVISFRSFDYCWHPISLFDISLFKFKLWFVMPKKPIFSGYFYFKILGALASTRWFIVIFACFYLFEWSWFIAGIQCCRDKITVSNIHVIQLIN
jgi:hypothetical protein